MKAIDVMTREPWTCKKDESLELAARIMWDNDIGCVVVVDEDRRAIAMVTDRDICMAAYTQGLPLREIRVATAMSRDLHACRPGDSLLDAWSLILRWFIRRLPVLDDSGVPVGVVSLNDIVRAQGEAKGRRTKDLTTEDVAKGLTEISAPRRELPVLVVAS